MSSELSERLQILEALSSARTGTSGKIGDLRFSVLHPPEFQRLHGKVWRLCDGSSMKGTKLAKVLQTDSLPDARGRFLRALNHNGGVDPDNSRRPGSPQDDAFAKHNHGGGNHKHSHGSSWYEGAIFANPRGYLSGGNEYHKDGEFAIHNSGDIIDFEGGGETRPKNVSFYLYVKVDE